MYGLQQKVWPLVYHDISTFQLGLYAHPIFSQEGDYPKLVKDRIAQKSFTEGFFKSRLPKFTEEESAYVQGKTKKVKLSL
jgi:lactase-phlorizin hydrolase